jgi:hypothetical protein
MTEAQSPLMNAIKYYIDNLNLDRIDTGLVRNSSELISQRSHIFYEKQGRGNSKPAVTLSVYKINYLVEHFIPLLSNLTFITIQGLRPASPTQKNRLISLI